MKIKRNDWEIEGTPKECKDIVNYLEKKYCLDPLEPTKEETKKPKKKMNFIEFMCYFIGGMSIASGLILLSGSILISTILVIVGVHLTIWGYKE